MHCSDNWFMLKHSIIEQDGSAERLAVLVAQDRPSLCVSGTVTPDLQRDFDRLVIFFFILCWLQ